MKESLVQLEPTNNPSVHFIGTAMVLNRKDGSKILLSYNVPVMKQYPDGHCVQFDNDFWLSHQTCGHIRAFSGLLKKQFLELPTEHLED